jgi:hypothetical protein
MKLEKGLEIEKLKKHPRDRSIDGHLFSFSSPLTLYTSPTMVVPVFFRRGATTPRCSSTALREHRSNEKPPELAIALLFLFLFDAGITRAFNLSFLFSLVKLEESPRALEKAHDLCCCPR